MSFFRAVANALDTMFQKGDRIAIDMPMTCNAVIIYLAIVLGGFVVVSIAYSFAPQEIGTRMGVSKAKAIFYSGKRLSKHFMVVYPFRTRCGLILNYTNFRISLLGEARKFHFTGIRSVYLVQIHVLLNKLICSFSKEKKLVFFSPLS